MSKSARGPVLSERKRVEGFTLVELLVVISIITILSIIGMVVFTNVQKGARNSKRIADMKAIALALDEYYNDPVNNFTYPNPGWGWRSECNGWGGLVADNVIPGLVPNYLAAFPSDPSMDKINNKSCYLYISSGTDYALLDYHIEEFTSSDYATYQSFLDPARGGTAWKISSPGGRGW